MDNRSDVRITLSENSFRCLSSHVDHYLRQNHLSPVNSILKHMDVCHQTKDAIYFGWNHIRWRESDDAIFMIMSGLTYLEECEYSYRFTRIGKDHEDLDEYSYDGRKDRNTRLQQPAIICRFDDSRIIRNMDHKRDPQR